MGSLLRYRWYSIAITLSILFVPIVSAQIAGPAREFRSLNTGLYQISIQKNGRVDVSAASGEPIFANAYPMVWFADDKKPEAVRIDGRYSQRFEVNDALGRGQGMRIRFKNIQWTLHAYPTKTYFTVQMAYINNSKKPVTIKQLIPWTIGDPKKGSVMLGPGTAESIMIVDGMDRRAHDRTTKEGIAPNMMAVLNPSTRRSLIAGFTTQVRAFNTVELKSLDDEADQFNYMRGINTYDPPIIVNPGEVLESEIFYFAIAESDPLLGMERYAKAVAMTNQIPVYAPDHMTNLAVVNDRQTEAEYRDTVAKAIELLSSRTSTPDSHRIIIGSTPLMLSQMQDTILTDLATKIHSAGFKVGLYVDPFRFDSDSDVVKLHPEWFVHEVKVNKSELVSTGLIDLRIPAAREWYLQHISQLQSSTDFDSLWEVDLTPYLSSMAWKFTDSGIAHSEFERPARSTNVQNARIAMNTLRAALVPETQIIIAQHPLLPVFPNSHQLVSRKNTSKFFQSPHLGFHYAVNQTSDSTPDLSNAEAATRGIHLIEMLDTPADQWNFDSAYQAPLYRPAKPRDLFASDEPSVWISQNSDPNGQWTLASVHNTRGETTRTVTLPLASPSPRVTTQYTLFDLDQQRYYGNAANQVNINVSAGQTRTMLLREYRGVPILVGTSLPLAYGTPDQTPTQWSSGTLMLQGKIKSNASDSSLYIHIPKGLKIVSATVDGAETSIDPSDAILRVDISASTTAETRSWTLQFARESAQ